VDSVDIPVLESAPEGSSDAEMHCLGLLRRLRSESLHEQWPGCLGTAFSVLHALVIPLAALRFSTYPETLLKHEERLDKS
jgi:hypothetical protein